MSSSSQKQPPLPASCVGCEGLTECLSPEEVQTYASMIPLWKINDDKTRISKTVRAKNFKLAMEYVNRVAEISEIEGHHPNLHVYSYNNIMIDLWTHKLGGLTSNDIVLAIKIDAIALAESRKAPEPMMG